MRCNSFICYRRQVQELLLAFYDTCTPSLSDVIIIVTILISVVIVIVVIVIIIIVIIIIVIVVVVVIIGDNICF